MPSCGELIFWFGFGGRLVLFDSSPRLYAGMSLSQWVVVFAPAVPAVVAAPLSINIPESPESRRLTSWFIGRGLSASWFPSD